MAEPRPTGLTRGLARLLRRPIAAADRTRAAMHVLDWVGCAAAGARTPPGVAMIAYGRTMPNGPCRAVGGLALSSRDAALVNGAFGTAL
jgi:2-methylcitrate dehydratase PrpD